MKLLSTKVVVLLAGLAALAATPRAEAGLIPVNVSITPDGGNFRWTYSVVLPTDMKLQAGNYFTIYDFAGYKHRYDKSVFPKNNYCPLQPMGKFDGTSTLNRHWSLLRDY